MVVSKQTDRHADHATSVTIGYIYAVVQITTREHLAGEIDADQYYLMTQEHRLNNINK